MKDNSIMEEYKHMVRVECITYNHSPFIENTMSGFCMQKTTFPFVCTIIDDASTDGEPEVINNYLKEYFDLDNKDVVRNKETDDYVLTFAQHKTNINCYFAVLFLKYNHNSIRKSKKQYIEDWNDTKYIALCEGDDYWTNPYKLQKQVDFLMAHPDYGMCYGQCRRLIQDKDSFEKRIWGGDLETFNDLLTKNNTIPTLTTLIRTDLFKSYANDVSSPSHNWLMGDYPRWLWISKESKIKFMPEVMGVYRVLSESASHSNSFEKTVSFLKSGYEIRKFFADKYNCRNLVKEDQLFYNLLAEAVKFRRKDEAKVYFKKIKHKTYKALVQYLRSVII